MAFEPGTTEGADLISKAMEELPAPVAVFSRNGEGERLYANRAMEALDTAEGDGPDKAMEELLARYRQLDAPEAYLFHGVEIFDGVYHVQCVGSGELLLLFFFPVAPGSFFNTMTFQELGESCSALVIVLNEEGILVDMNNCFLELAGVETEEAVGLPFFQTFIPGDLGALDHYFREILTGESYHQHFVTPLRRKDGQIYRVNWQVSRVLKQGRTYIIAVGSDISKYVEENQRLKKNLQSISLGFDHFPHGVAYLDGKGRFLRINPRFAAMFGLEEREKERRFDQIPALEKQIGFRQMLQTLEEKREGTWRVEEERNGRKIGLAVDARLVRGKKEEARFYILAVHRVR